MSSLTVRKSLGVALGAVASIIVFSLASAHESWLQPVSFFIDRPAEQVVRLTSGMGEHYPTPETAVERERVVRSGVFLQKERLPLVVGDTGKAALNLSWTPTTTGVAAMWVELAPKTLELADSLIDVYFDEIGASPQLRKEWTDTPSPKKWRESYAKHAKSYARIGSLTSTPGFTANAGLKLEIVPDRDPTRLRVGDRLGLRVLLDGKPLPHFTIAAFREGGSKPQFVKSDAKGFATLRVDHAGGMLLAGVHLRRVHEPNLEWRSDFTSMTFPVRSR
jgi:hypothetical protein